MKIRIYGASDDLVEVEGCPGADEFNSYESTIVMWRGDLRAPDGSFMRVHALYDGCWSFAPGMVGEDHPFPAWPFMITPHQGFEDSTFKVPYTVLLEIDAPDGTELVNVWPAQGGDDD